MRLDHLRPRTWLLAALANKAKAIVMRRAELMLEGPDKKPRKSA